MATDIEKYYDEKNSSDAALQATAMNSKMQILNSAKEQFNKEIEAANASLASQNATAVNGLQDQLSKQGASGYVSDTSKLRLNSAYGNANTALNQVRSNQIQNINDNIAYLGNSYKATLAEIKAQNELSKLNALKNQESTDYNRNLEKAQTLGQYGDFSGYKSMGINTTNMETAYKKQQELNAEAAKKEALNTAAGNTAAEFLNTLSSYNGVTISNLIEGDNLVVNNVKMNNSDVLNGLNNGTLVIAKANDKYYIMPKENYDNYYNNASGNNNLDSLINQKAITNSSSTNSDGSVNWVLVNGTRLSLSEVKDAINNGSLGYKDNGDGTYKIVSDPNYGKIYVNGKGYVDKDKLVEGLQSGNYIEYEDGKYIQKDTKFNYPVNSKGLTTDVTIDASLRKALSSNTHKDKSVGNINIDGYVYIDGVGWLSDDQFVYFYDKGKLKKSGTFNGAMGVEKYINNGLTKADIDALLSKPSTNNEFIMEQNGYDDYMKQKDNTRKQIINSLFPSASERFKKIGIK